MAVVRGGGRGGAGKAPARTVTQTRPAPQTNAMLGNMSGFKYAPGNPAPPRTQAGAMQMANQMSTQAPKTQYKGGMLPDTSEAAAYREKRMLRTMLPDRTAGLKNRLKSMMNFDSTDAEQLRKESRQQSEQYWRTHQIVSQEDEPDFDLGGTSPQYGGDFTGGGGYGADAYYFNYSLVNWRI